MRTGRSLAPARTRLKSCGPPSAEYLHASVELLLELARLGDGELVDQAEVEELLSPFAASGAETLKHRRIVRQLGMRCVLLRVRLLPVDLAIDGEHWLRESAEIVDRFGADRQLSCNGGRIRCEREGRSAILRLVRQQLLDGQRAG